MASSVVVIGSSLVKVQRYFIYNMAAMFEFLYCMCVIICSLDGFAGSMRSAKWYVGSLIQALHAVAFDLNSIVSWYMIPGAHEPMSDMLMGLWATDGTKSPLTCHTIAKL